MSKNTFINGLKEALKEGNISDSEIKDTINYYESYFDEKEAKGANVEEILDELGDPRLIAKTIIDTKGSNYSTEADDNKYNTGQYDSRTNDKYDNDKYTRYGNIYVKNLKLMDKVKIGLFILAIVLLLLCMIVFAFKMIVFFLPVVLIILLLVLLSRLFLK